MTFTKTQYLLATEANILSFIFTHTEKGLGYAISTGPKLVLFHQEKVLEEWELPKSSIDWTLEVQLQLSPNDQYLAIYNTYGQHGFVLELKRHQKLLDLNRQDYRIEHSKFPILFFEKEEKDYLIHGTDWNKIDITELGSLTVITERNNTDPKQPHYLDFFYGELHLSPKGKTLLSSGWLWGPASYFRFIELDGWMHENKNQAELGSPANVCIMSYYWDRALCWIDESSLAYLYDPKEEGFDKEELIEEGFESNQGHLIIYNMHQFKAEKKIPFEGFSRNEYHEASPDCRLFHLEDRLLISSRKKGTYVLDLPTAKTLSIDPGIYLERRIAGSNRFFSMSEGKKVEIIDLTTA